MSLIGYLVVSFWCSSAHALPFSMSVEGPGEFTLSFHHRFCSDTGGQYTEYAYGSLIPVAGVPEDTSERPNSPAPPPSVSRLLPAKISAGEKFFWGENGVFRKIGLTSPLSVETRKHELSVRRTMLTAHQIGGFLTLGSMIAAVYYGQRVIDGKRSLSGMHNTFVLSTILSYSATGLLAVLSPPPLIRRDEVSTTTLHKTLAWIHFTGMVITPILGQFVGGRRHLNITRAHFHQVAGYLTTAAFASAMIVVTF